MCIMTAQAQVAATSILARSHAEGEQILVYSMRVTASEPVAMVLPLPVRMDAGEDALRFINLEGYADFFEDLERAFTPEAAAFGDLSGGLATPRAQHLQVHAVGAFEASFVPSRADFERLDPRFRLSEEVWAALPDYDDWGFAVFQLATGSEASRTWWQRMRGAPLPVSHTRTIHPMAFAFPSREPQRLYFPTVHVHDGAVHEEARFDHALYYQPPESGAMPAAGFRGPESPLRSSVNAARARGVLDVTRECFKMELVGMLPNRDTYVDV